MMERLTNNDFRELIPHLPLADIFLIEVDCPITKRWKKAIELIDKVILKYKCNLCDILIVGPKTLVSHLEGKKHAFNVDNSGQFYHPVYTFLKNDRKLARGENVKPEMLALAERKCRDHLKNYARKFFIEALDMAELAEQKIIELDKKFPQEASKRAPNKPKIVYSAKDIAEQAKKRRGKDTHKNDFTQKNQHSPAQESKDKVNVEVIEEDDNNDMEEPSQAEKIAAAAEIEETQIDEKIKTEEEDETSNPDEEQETECENDVRENKSQDLEHCGIEDENLPEGTKQDQEQINAPEAPLISASTQEHEVEKSDADTFKNEKRNDFEEKSRNSERPYVKFIDVRTALEMAKIDLKQKVKRVKKMSSPPPYIEKPKKEVSPKVNCESDKLQGLIGIEYVLKITKSSDDSKPIYECCLCEVRHNETGMQRHLLGYIHRFKYCEINYPSCLARYQRYIKHLSKHEAERVLHPILNKLAIEIEAYHGHDLPFECPHHLYMENRRGVIAKTHSLRHACESYGPSFTNVVSKEEIMKFIEDRFKFKIPDLSKVEIKFFKRAPGVFYLAKKGGKLQKNEISLAPKQLELGRGKRRRTPSPFVPRYDREVDNRRRSISPDSHRRKRRLSTSPQSTNRAQPSKRHRSTSVSPLREGDVWQAYRHLVDRNKEIIDRLYDEYRIDPENHPQYDEEWNKFWRMRKGQLIAQGIDHRSYNYQPEWVQYFKSRLEELYSNAVENVKVESRKRLCLPVTNNDNLRDRKYHVNDPQILNMVSYPIGNMPSLPSLSMPIFGNNNYGKKQSSFNQNSGSNQFDRSREQQGIPQFPPHIYRSPDYNNMDIPLECDMTNSIPSFNPIDANCGKPTVLSVLRLMTALEEHLGSLGPKIIDLLTKSLTAEKTHPTQVESMILTPKNCTLLETAMEKLKGVMLAGLLDGVRIRAFTRVIIETEKLLAIAEEHRTKALSDSSTPMKKNANVGGRDGRSVNDMPQTNPTNYLNSSINDYVRSMGANNASSNLWQNLQNIRRNVDFNLNRGMNPEKDMRSNNFNSIGMDMKSADNSNNMDSITNYNSFVTTNRNFDRNSALSGSSAANNSLGSINDRSQMQNYSFGKGKSDTNGRGGTFGSAIAENSAMSPWSNRSNYNNSSMPIGSNSGGSEIAHNLKRSIDQQNMTDIGMGHWATNSQMQNARGNLNINPRNIGAGSRGNAPANSNWRQ